MGPAESYLNVPGLPDSMFHGVNSILSAFHSLPNVGDSWTSIVYELHVSYKHRSFEFCGVYFIYKMLDFSMQTGLYGDTSCKADEDKIGYKVFATEKEFDGFFLSCRDFCYERCVDS